MDKIKYNDLGNETSSYMHTLCIFVGKKLIKEEKIFDFDGYFKEMVLALGNYSRQYICSSYASLYYMVDEFSQSQMTKLAYLDSFDIYKKIDFNANEGKSGYVKLYEMIIKTIGRMKSFILLFFSRDKKSRSA